jgi:hypothetical protein
MAEREPFDLDLADAFRGYLEDAPTQVRPSELARHLATTYPRGRTAFGPWRLGPTVRLAWVLLLLAGLLFALLGGMLTWAPRGSTSSRLSCRPSASCTPARPGRRPTSRGRSTRRGRDSRRWHSTAGRAGWWPSPPFKLQGLIFPGEPPTP